MYDFRWIAWNVDHIAEHGIAPDEAEQVVNHAPRGYPRRTGGDAFLVRGRTQAGTLIQVIYTIDPPPLRSVFVFHARPLTPAEVRRYFPRHRRR